MLGILLPVRLRSNLPRSDGAIISSLLYLEGPMNCGARSLYHKYAFRSKHDKASFEQGTMALKTEIEQFIQKQLKDLPGETCLAGLRGVVDHLECLFTEKS